jgi:hypothetical protein
MDQLVAQASEELKTKPGRKVQTSFEIDAPTRQAIDDLKQVYQVTSNAGVIKRAVRIALIASRFSDENRDLHFMVTEGEQKREIVVPQRY